MDWDGYNQFLLALTMWREARGEGAEGMKAVGCVIRNRAHNGTWSQVMTAKWQFSSLTAPGDPMLVQWPVQEDAQFLMAMSLAAGIYLGTIPDSTDGATHYFNPNVVKPKWAQTLTKVVTIGHHDFYK